MMVIRAGQTASELLCLRKQPKKEAKKLTEMVIKGKEYKKEGEEKGIQPDFCNGQKYIHIFAPKTEELKSKSIPTCTEPVWPSGKALGW